jgi:hypothetical protein
MADRLARRATCPATSHTNSIEAASAISLDTQAMAAAMRNASGDDGFFAKHIANRPHLFSSLPVFLPRADLARKIHCELADVAQAVEIA